MVGEPYHDAGLEGLEHYFVCK